MNLIEQPLAQREVRDEAIAYFKRKKFFISINLINLCIEKKLHFFVFLYVLKSFVIFAFRLACSHAYIKFQLVKQESNGKGWLNFIPYFFVCAHLCNSAVSPQSQGAFRSITAFLSLIPQSRESTCWR